MQRLPKLLKITGPCDFLKIDCEGCEWYINSGELDGFRRIECEVHNFDGKHPFERFAKLLKDAGFNYEMRPVNKLVCLFHASK